MKTTTGLTITEIKMKGATRIEVDSKKYNEDAVYRNENKRGLEESHVTETLNSIFKSFNEIYA